MEIQNEPAGALAQVVTDKKKKKKKKLTAKERAKVNILSNKLPKLNIKIVVYLRKNQIKIAKKFLKIRLNATNCFYQLAIG